MIWFRDWMIAAFLLFLLISLGFPATTGGMIAKAVKAYQIEMSLP